MSDNDCIFCKIAHGEFGTTFIAEDDQAVAFDDISPRAPVHVLVVSKDHIRSVNELDEAHAEFWASARRMIQDVAQKKGIAESGYRIVSNAGPDSGQEVPHLHIHVLGGGPLGTIC